MKYTVNKNILVILLLYIFTNSAIAGNFTIDIQSPHLDNTIIIKVKNSLRAVCLTDKINEPTLEATLNNIGAFSVRKKFPLHKVPTETFNRFGEKLIDISLIYEIKINGSVALDKAISNLLSTGKLEYAQPHYIQQVFYSPNDPSTALQYYLDKINAYEAWDIEQSDTNTVIGITDTGSDIFHPDLVNNVKYNYSDPIDGSDNDTDGYTDNFYGWDLGENDNLPQCNANFHGLHTTGICNATVDNSIGIAGVGFKARFLPVKIADGAGILNSSYEGIVYAADHGCSIINCSWGGTGAGQYGQDIVNYATFNKNCLLVVSAGNDGNAVLFYPASYENALSIAASDQVDHKKATSSYGTMVDVSAPGEDIYSTWINGSYLSSGGTSTAAPVVAGAAAIVRSFFPAYSPLQVGEQLKATCDIIDTIGFNQPYSGKLGRGRINLFRALTETDLPSIVLTQHNVTDNNDNAFVIGDTLRLTGTFTNYLANDTGVTVNISTTSPYINIIDSVINLGIINTLQSVNNNTSPFTAKILTGIPQNTDVEFKLTITDNAGNIFLNYITVAANVDFINININEVATTISSKGNIGYNGNGNQATQGLGFIFNGSNLLWEAGLLVGNNSTQVSDRVRGISGLDADFSVVSNVARQIPGTVSEFDVNGIFNDDGAGASKLPVKVLQSSYCWTTPGNTRYVMFKYQIINTGTNPLATLHAGILADWDISGNLNKADFDAGNNLGYCYSSQSGIYAGIKLLSNTAPINSYAIDNVSGGAGGIDPVGGISATEKYTSLTTTRAHGGGTGNGNDVMHVVSSGPFNLLPGDTAEVAFALLAGDSLADLQSTAIAAQNKYDGFLVTNYSKQNDAGVFFVYPNPASQVAYVRVNDHENNNLNRFTISDISGKIIAVTLTAISNGLYTIDTHNLDNGLYIINAVTGSKTFTNKLILNN